MYKKILGIGIGLALIDQIIKYIVNMGKGETGLKTVNVVAALIINQDQVFATQRGYGEFKDGWEFPGLHTK